MACPGCQQDFALTDRERVLRPRGNGHGSYCQACYERRYGSPEKRFWAKVDRRGPDECWLWLGARDKDGYGAFGSKRAHRISLILTLGRRLAQGGCSLHRCDNPPCVNPKHLFLGSVDVNNKDAVAKGRVASGDRNGSRLHPERLVRGEAHHQAKLTAETVRAIRVALEKGAPQRLIASSHGVSQKLILCIKQGRIWREVA